MDARIISDAELRSLYDAEPSRHVKVRIRDVEADDRQAKDVRALADTRALDDDLVLSALAGELVG